MWKGVSHQWLPNSTSWKNCITQTSYALIKWSSFWKCRRNAVIRVLTATTIAPFLRLCNQGQITLSNNWFYTDENQVLDIMNAFITMPKRTMSLYIKEHLSLHSRGHISHHYLTLYWKDFYNHVLNSIILYQFIAPYDFKGRKL